ncbi:uncharacterized protein MYCFIDRAFT_135704 [Pseudocercospora fijiensis CIRAD86]|uniref:Uncharacterized protein n=1 Tax=Pseudocercospora fijiensis (strain CIRAD86) TaxID=383855 RepID=M3B4B3_PSEFD|nr:uncharacterized protein MYCFIDRAFT_135704 [Pseudocercospora fijiensis CIRAD86]EME84187.1 hypothetical protein MYCFIDRAFT_135704 [Pseudocercospora fijiensis CIRAD86]
MSDQIEICTEVTPFCPVEATTYGYYPNIAGNSVLLSIFALCTISQLILGIRFRIIAFSTVVLLASLAECIGYGGRLMMHDNPWSDAGFKIQVVCLILAPSFLAAGIYLTLKHIVLALGPEKSRLQPKFYTWIFITCDAISIVMQAIGGGIASAGEGETINIGNHIMIAGIAFQVATMALCIYRLPEMAGGWGNPLMRNEKEFLILDGTMIAIATVLLTVAHPGIFFPAMRNKASKEASQREVKDVELSTPEEVSERY